MTAVGSEAGPDGSTQPVQRVADTRARYLAAQVDGLIVGVPLLAAWWAGAALAAALNRSFPTGSWLIAAVVLWLAVEIAGTARWGANPGKAVYGLRVVNAAAEPVGLRPVFVRTLVRDGPVLVAIPLVLLQPAAAVVAGLAVAILWPVVLLVSIARDPLRRGLHDRAGRTWVVEGRASADSV